MTWYEEEWHGNGSSWVTRKTICTSHQDIEEELSALQRKRAEQNKYNLQRDRPLEKLPKIKLYLLKEEPALLAELIGASEAVHEGEMLKHKQRLEREAEEAREARRKKFEELQAEFGGEP